MLKKMLLGICLLPALGAAQEVRIKEIASIKGNRPNHLIGLGLVIGLQGTGDSAVGRITAMTASSLTIKSGSGEMTFSVDANTRVLARGAGRATQQARAAGSGPAISDLLKVGEDVVVSYRTSGSTRVANEVRVRSPRPR